MSWQLASAALLAVVLAAGVGWFERSRPSAKVVALVASLAALAVVGRLAFAAFPNVKPTTDIVLFAGFAVGAAPGFAVGAITALASNVFFGQGPWTPWQMAAWGLVGVAGALVGRVSRGRELRRLPLALICALAGFGYGALLDLYQWTLAATHTPGSYLAISGSSFPYNLAHAVGNFVFALAIGPSFVRALRRYRRRFEVRWEQPVVAAALLPALLVAAGVAVRPPNARAAGTAKQRALHYLLRAQNSDGGFGGAPGQSSSPLFTGWVGLGLAAAGDNPQDVRRRNASVISYMRRHLPGARDVGGLERTILLVRASGLSSRNFGHRDLVAELLALRKSDGSFDHLVDHTAFAVLALRAGGVSRSALRGSTIWLEQQQNRDGGFGFGQKGGASDADDTGSTLEAIAAAGLRRSAAARAAVRYLRHAQRSDGGFGQMRGDPSNAQSTAWAVQGLVAAGVNPSSLRSHGHTPLSYISSLQQASGAIRYSRASAQTPVWVTGEAVAALARKAFPVAAPKRRRVHAAAATVKAPARPAASKPPASHGQTIVPFRRKKTTHAAAPTATRPSHATGTVPQVSATPTARHHPAPAIRNAGGGSGALPYALGGLAAAAVAAGGYLTRRRLRARSRPA